MALGARAKIEKTILAANRIQNGPAILVKQRVGKARHAAIRQIIPRIAKNYEYAL
jgi:hypothetical protein